MINVLIAVLALFCVNAQAAPQAAQPAIIPPQVSVKSIAEADVMSFRQWKGREVERIRTQIQGLDDQIQDLTAQEFVTTNFKQSERGEFDKQLAEAKFNLEVVLELTVNDYFVLYLSQFKDKQNAFAQAAGKLDKTELVQLMMAYDQHLQSTRGLGDTTMSPLTGGVNDSVGPGSL